MPGANELLPLLHHQANARFPSFFSRAENNPLQIIKKICLIIAGTFSGFMFWPSSFHAAEKLDYKSLKYVAAVGGTLTNAFFNVESLFNIFELLSRHKMSLKYFVASAISFFCVLPNFLMSIEDEDGHYISNGYIVLEGIIGLLNVVVNVVGSIELIDSISTLFCKPKTEQEKAKLREKLDLASKLFSQIKPEEQTEAKFYTILNEQFKSLSYLTKTARYPIKILLGILSLPQLLAYTLISYFDVKKLVENKLELGNVASIVLGSLAALLNTIPGAGFSLKGLNSIYERLISLEKPSLLALFFVFPASFSGFSTHKAMADSLKHLDTSNDVAEVLKWSANLGAAFLYNLPQIIFLADRITAKKTNDIPDNIKNSIQTLKTYIELLNTNPYQAFTTALANGQLLVAGNGARQANPPNSQETSMTYTSLQPH